MNDRELALKAILEQLSSLGVKHEVATEEFSSFIDIDFDGYAARVAKDEIMTGHDSSPATPTICSINDDSIIVSFWDYAKPDPLGGTGLLNWVQILNVPLSNPNAIKLAMLYIRSVTNRQ